MPAIGKPSLLFIVILGDCSTDVGCGGGLLFEGRCIVASSLEVRLLRLPVKIAASCSSMMLLALRLNGLSTVDVETVARSVHCTRQVLAYDLYPSI